MNTEIRKCSGAVMFRRVENGFEYMLVTSTKNRARWVLPKGGIEDDLDAAQNAVKECREECGYVIDLPTVDDAIHVCLELKDDTLPQKVTFFMAEAREEVEWEEAHLRSRAWVTFRHAAKVLSAPQNLALRRTAVMLGDLTIPDTKSF